MTIIAGGSRSGARFWTWHLQRTDGGQSVDVRDTVGLIGQDMAGWFAQMEAMSAGGNTTNYFYHFNINPREDEAYTPEQLKVAVETTLENLGLDGQPYFLVEHDKDGRSPHYHCIVLRVDLDSGKAISDSHNYAIHMRTADELEERFGHERTKRGRGPDGPNPKGYEVQRGQETGIDPKTVAVELKALWHQCDTGKAFAAAIEERGYILAKGDRAFVVVDPGGDEHSLGRRVGAKAAEVRARMAAIDREALPTVTEARALARERADKREDRDDQRDASSLPVRHDRKHSPGALESIAEELVETLWPPAAEKPPSQVPEYSPIVRAQPSLFERLAQKAADAIRSLRNEPTAAESVDPLAQPAQPLSGPDAEPATFERAAREFIKGAKDAAPIAEQLAIVAADVIDHRPADAAHFVAQPEFSAFEKLTAERFEALRAVPGDGLFMHDAIDWQARETGTPFLPEPVAGAQPTAFERATQEAFAATRDNGGEPVTGDGSSFWSRARSAIADAYDRAAGWVRETARDFVGRLLERRERGPDDHGRER